jgi:hypothetical protein
VVIELGRSLIPDGWHLDRLKVVCVEPAATYVFTCEAWLDKKHGTRKEWTLEGHLAKQDMSLRLGEAFGVASATGKGEHEQTNSQTGQLESNLSSPGVLPVFEPSPAQDKVDRIAAQPWTAPSRWSLASVGKTLQQAPHQEYCVRVLTSNRLGAGTDAKVHLVLEDVSGARSALSLLPAWFLALV